MKSLLVRIVESFLTGIGIAHILLMLFEMFDVIDYHICIKGPGECGIHEVKL